MEASDVIYTDTLEYYSQVNDARKRRIDPAETLWQDLRTLFERPSRTKEDKPTASFKDTIEGDLTDIVETMMQGKSNKEIADTLLISIRTVGASKNVYKKVPLTALPFIR